MAGPALAATDPVVGRPPLDESRLHRVGAEPVLLNQVPRQAVAQLVRLAVGVRVLTDRYHPRVADRLIQPCQVLLRPFRAQSAQ